MKKRVIGSFTAFILASTFSIYAQENNYIKHRVNRGETVSKIARDYGVSVSDIFEHNPGAKDGIREDAFILIPNKDATPVLTQTKKDSFSKTNTHLVEPKETLYAISKKYKVTVADLYKWNPGLKENGLKAGETINLTEDKTIAQIKEKIAQNTSLSKDQALVINNKIPASTIDTVDTKGNGKFMVVQVAAKETLYGLAVEYKTTIQHILALNPELKDQDLKIGQEVKIPVISFKKGFGRIEEEQIKAKIAKDTFEEHQTLTIQPKQTLYSISKEYDISVEELVNLNPDLKYGLKTGMELRIPANATKKKDIVAETKAPAFETKSNTFYDLTLSLDKQNRKELALLLPFNTAKIGGDVAQKLKSDSFLNMTLEFYSGALLAIEEAERLGLPLDVKIYDSNETKTSSDVSSIFLKEDLSNTDVIVGPFFQKNVDMAVAKLPNSKVVLVSPLSNEKASTNGNVVQTMPYADVLKKQLIDHFVAQKATIIAVIDEKNTSTRSFLQQYFPNVRVVNGKAANTVGNYLSTAGKNVVILDSNSIVTALTTTNHLKSKLNDYNIQLAAFERNDVFDYNEIDINTLVALKLIYPSVTRESESDKASAFAKDYKAKNNIYPSRFATRGYDVTLDVILRMFQANGFTTSLEKNSQQIENKFMYSKNPQGTVRNSGVFLLQYDEDLTLKVIQ